MKFNKDDILGFETDTVWGIGCHPLNEACVSKIYEIKTREKEKPLILMSHKFENFLPYIKNVPPYAEKLAEKFFPGGLTLIFEKTDFCPLFITSNKNTIGVRVPNHEGFIEISKNFEGEVLATTSLNISGEKPVKNYDEANLKFGSEIKVIKPLPLGKRPVGTASTVVLCTKEAPVVLRQGAIYI